MYKMTHSGTIVRNNNVGKKTLNLPILYPIYVKIKKKYL